MTRANATCLSPRNPPKHREFAIERSTTASGMPFAQYVCVERKPWMSATSSSALSVDTRRPPIVGLLDTDVGESGLLRDARMDHREARVVRGHLLLAEQLLAPGAQLVHLQHPLVV